MCVTERAGILHALYSCARHRHVDLALALRGERIDARNKIVLAVERGEAELRCLQEAHELLGLVTSKLQRLCDRLHKGKLASSRLGENVSPEHIALHGKTNQIVRVGLRACHVLLLVNEIFIFCFLPLMSPLLLSLFKKLFKKFR